ncbi:MAG: NUDIX domain-containing protein [Candidatus Andersenbacteria bacterium]
MEYFDAYNERGEKIGEVVSRNQAHEQGIWHATIHVWIINSKQELLIQRRSPEKESNPGMWGVASVGGHISAGDDAITTAIRETEEELGLVITGKELEYLFTTPHQQVLNKGTYISNHFDNSYLVEKDIDSNNLKLQTGEVSEVKWIHFTDLEQLIQQRNPEFVENGEYEKLFPLLHRRYL